MRQEITLYSGNVKTIRLIEKHFADTSFTVTTRQARRTARTSWSRPVDCSDPSRCSQPSSARHPQYSPKPCSTSPGRHTTAAGSPSSDPIERHRPMTEWQKDLSAVGFEMADLVQRVRTMVLATGSLCDRVPEELSPAVAQARFSIDAAVA